MEALLRSIPGFVSFSPLHYVELQYTCYVIIWQDTVYQWNHVLWSAFLSCHWLGWNPAISVWLIRSLPTMSSMFCYLDMEKISSSSFPTLSLWLLPSLPGLPWGPLWHHLHLVILPPIPHLPHACTHMEKYFLAIHCFNMHFPTSPKLLKAGAIPP